MPVFLPAGRCWKSPLGVLTPFPLHRELWGSCEQGHRPRPAGPPGKTRASFPRVGVRSWCPFAISRPVQRSDVGRVLQASGVPFLPGHTVPGLAVSRVCSQCLPEPVVTVLGRKVPEVSQKKKQVALLVRSRTVDQWLARPPAPVCTLKARLDTNCSTVSTACAPQ